MSILLETTLGDIVIDLDVDGSPELCKNVLKLAKARYYTSTLFHNILPNRFCQLGDPHGDGSGGACIQGLIATDGSLEKVLQSSQRFLKSNMGRPLTQDECREKGRVVATEMNGIPNTIGSQLLITIVEGQDMALDGYTTNASIEKDDTSTRQIFRSVGIVSEDENDVLGQIASTYCDAEGRPYADIRIKRALIVDDPFEDPPGMDRLYQERGVIFEDGNDRVMASPDYERPNEEKVEIRIQADQIDPLTGEEDLEKLRQKEDELLKRQDKSRAVVLEMLGDLPSADIKAPENVLFVCKLNPVTEDEDLELIFSRFDEKVKAEIIRDSDTGSSLQYAFIEFTTKEQAVEAYFKMNNALVDDRRIKVDFSQSVAKVWDKYNQRMRNPSGQRSNHGMPLDPYNGGGRGPPRGNRGNNNRSWNSHRNDRQQYHDNQQYRRDRPREDFRRDYDRERRQQDHSNGKKDPSKYSRSSHPHRDTEPRLERDQFGREIRRDNYREDDRFRNRDRSESSSREERRRSDRKERKHHKKHHKDRKRHKKHRSGDRERRHRRSRSRSRSNNDDDDDYRRRRERSRDKRHRDDDDHHRSRRKHHGEYRDESSHRHRHKKRSRHDSPDSRN